MTDVDIETLAPILAEHPVLKGFQGFESWDETYVHTKHNEKGRTVLEYRADGDKKAAPKKTEAAPAPKTVVKKAKKIVKDEGENKE